ncbi:MAG TPA: helix-turn-helix transcriptional regulator [Elusimicrobiota bacterium]|nr:helix-turn-helix transcriptional regulator [Elusimicrobiota bacterium]
MSGKKGSESFNARLKRDLKDPEFAKAFEELYLDAVIAEKLQALREKRHLTQKQLADKAGMAQNAVSRIEKGENSLTLRTVQRLAGALGCVVELEFKPVKGRPLAAA